MDDGDKQQILVRDSNMVKDTTVVVADPYQPAPCRGVWYLEPEGYWRDDSVFFVERIVSKRRGAGGQLEYFVKWWNYEADENTWEPEKNCTEDSQQAVKTFKSTQEEWGMVERQALRTLLLAPAPGVAKGVDAESEAGRRGQWEKIAKELRKETASERSANECELEAWKNRHDTNTATAWHGMTVAWVVKDDDNATTEDEAESDSDQGGGAKTSRFRGVCRWSGDTKWQVECGTESGDRYVGSYDDEIEAAQAYDTAAAKRYGDSAKLNFPNGAAGSKRKPVSGRSAAAAAGKKKRKKEPPKKNPKKERPPPPPPPPKQRGFTIVKGWKDLQPSCERLASAELTAEAKAVLAKKSKETKGGELKWMNNTHKDKIGEEAVLAALSNPKLLQQQVGLGQITDEEHPCMRESIDAGRETESPPYLGYAKRALGANVVVGEYTGFVKLESTVQEMEERRGVESTEPVDDIPMAYNYMYQGTARWDHGSSQLTVDAFSSGNELRYVNDYRDDLDHYGDKSKQSRSANVEAMEVWLHGRPHILMVTTQPLAIYEELLVDYGDQYWGSFLKSHGRAKKQQALVDEKEKAEQRALAAERALAQEAKGRMKAEGKLAAAEKEIAGLKLKLEAHPP